MNKDKSLIAKIIYFIVKVINSENKILNIFKGLIGFTIIWYIASVFIGSNALPSPFKVYASIPSELDKTMMIHTLTSLWRLLAALIISIVIGLVVGGLMGRFKKVNNLLYPLIYFTYPIPKTALLPVIMILFGLGDSSKITLIVLITVFQMIVSVRDAVANIDKEYFMPLYSLGATEIQIVKNVTVYAILPSLLTSIRLSIGTALSILFFAENYGTSFGLGYYIQDCWSRIDYISMYVGIMMISFIGFALFILIDILENKFCSWKNN